MNRIERHSITVHGVRLQYLEVSGTGRSDRAPLLVLHQLLATAETLGELMEALPSDRRILALDILSATPEAGSLNMSADSLARLVADFAQAVGLSRAVLVGHSHGGTLALWLAAQPSGLCVESLVLLSPAHPFAGYRAHVVAFYLTRWGRFLALRIPLAPSRMILWAYNQAAGSAVRLTLGQLKPHLVILRSRRALCRVLEILRTWEEDMTRLRNLMISARIEQPTLLLWGDRDVVVPMDSATALEQHLAQSERVTFTEYGHLLPQEAPKACAEQIASFLTANPQG